MSSNILFVVVAGNSQDASGMSRTYRRPPVRCEIAAMCATDASQLHQHNKINASASISLTNRHDAMTGAMLFCNLRKYDCLFSFFRHQTSSCQRKKHGQFWQSAVENARLRKQLQAKDATFSNMQQSMTRSGKQLRTKKNRANKAQFKLDLLVRCSTSAEVFLRFGRSRRCLACML